MNCDRLFLTLQYCNISGSFAAGFGIGKLLNNFLVSHDCFQFIHIFQTRRLIKEKLRVSIWIKSNFLFMQKCQSSTNANDAAQKKRKSDMNMANKAGYAYDYHYEPQVSSFFYIHIANAQRPKYACEKDRQKFGFFLWLRIVFGKFV